MAELPHMPMFWGDYFGDTRHLTCLEHGAYLQLLGQYWLDGHGLPDDDKRLSRLVGMSLKEWLTIRDTIAEFFAISGGVWLHNRVERELALVRRRVEQAREAGRASAAARSSGRSTKKERSPNDRSNGRSNGRSNARSTDAQPPKPITINNPLTPLRGAGADAPGPSGGRASAGTEARPIGQILQVIA